MEFLALLVVAISIALFGLFFAYERNGPLWSGILSLVFAYVACFVSAWVDAGAMSVSKEFTFNVVVLNSFVFGYTIGYPYKRDWWKYTVALTGGAVILLLAYSAYVLV